MRIDNGSIKPCSNCLRARQAAKNAVDRVTGRFHDFKVVTTTLGRLVIDNRSSTVTQADTRFAEFVGRKVYISGRIIYDVDAAKPLGALGNVVDIVKNNEGTL